MKKYFKFIFVAFVLIFVSVNVSAVSFQKEYADNMQRYIYKTGSGTNLIGKTTNVKPKQSIKLGYKVGNKYIAAKYTSSNTKVATVNAATGLVKFLTTGKVTITVAGSDKKTYKTYFNSAGVQVNISIKSQRAMLYVNGQLKKSVPIVTGRAGVTPTPKGTFKIAYKQTNTYLDGSTVGYDYYLHVKYWMPLAGTGGVGLHDASWRSYNSFGGNYYKWDGSHGCINMRTSDAAYFYRYISAGTIVNIY